MPLMAVSATDLRARLARQPGALDELSDFLAQQPERLIGLWIEGDRPRGGRQSSDGTRLLARLATVPVLDLRPLRLHDRWSLCRIGTLSRVTLLDLLMYLACGSHPGAAGRFVPVFPADESPADRWAAWASLAEHYPGIVLPPLAQDAGGVLACDDVSLPVFPATRAQG